MKKKIFGGITVLAIAAMAAFNLNLNTQENDMSLLSLANVEALASEGDGPITNSCTFGGTECVTLCKINGVVEVCTLSGYRIL